MEDKVIVDGVEVPVLEKAEVEDFQGMADEVVKVTKERGITVKEEEVRPFLVNKSV